MVIEWYSAALGFVAACIVAMVIWLIYHFAFKDKYTVGLAQLEQGLTSHRAALLQQLSSPSDRANLAQAMQFADAAASAAQSSNAEQAVSSLTMAVNSLVQVSPAGIAAIVPCLPSGERSIVSAMLNDKFAPVVPKLQGLANALPAFTQWCQSVLANVPDCTK